MPIRAEGWFADGLADVEAMVDWVDEIIKVIDATDLTDAEKMSRLRELRKVVDDEDAEATA